MSRSRLGATALLAAIFVLGAIAGGAVTSWLDRRDSGPGPGDRGRRTYMERLEAEVGALSAAQRDSIQAVLDRHQPAMDSIWAGMRPRIEAERQSMRQEIRAHLTDDQVRRYNEAIERQERRRQEMERSRNGRR